MTVRRSEPGSPKVLQNRPLEADRWFAAFKALSLVAGLRLIGRWCSPLLDAFAAGAVADQAQALHPTPVLEGLGDLSGVVGGQLWRFPAQVVRFRSGNGCRGRTRFTNPLAVQGQVQSLR